MKEVMLPLLAMKITYYQTNPPELKKYDTRKIHMKQLLSEIEQIGLNVNP